MLHELQEVLKMLAATSPSPPPFQGAVEASNGILVTREVKQTFEPIRFDINELIRMPVANEPCYVPTGQTEPKPSDWDQIKSAPEIRVVGKSSDGAWARWLCMLQSFKSFLAGISPVVLSARHDLINRIQFFLSPALWYNFWIVVSGVVLYATVLRYLESSLACKILLFSTCGEFFALFKRPDRRFLLVCASLSFLKFILTCVLFFVDRSELIGIGGFLALSILIICGLQSALSQIYRLVAHSEHGSSAFDVDIESGVLDLKLGRQYFRNHSLDILHSKFDYISYTLIRLSNLGNHKREEIFVKLEKVGSLHEVSSALDLPDESWEIVVLKSYLLELEIRLGEIFPGCHFDPNYDPTEPSKEDVERVFVATKNSKLPAEPGEIVADVKQCYTTAKILRIYAFSIRAMDMIEEGWPLAAAYYSCLLKRNMTWLMENTPYGRKADVIG